MKKRATLYIFSALAVALSLAGFALWRFDAHSREALDQAMRQYGQARTLIERYQSLRRLSAPKNETREGNLFAQINQIGTELGLARRIEALRPSGDKGMETLDLQIRNLYLGEFLRFLRGVESLDNVRIERLSLNRPASGLLDMEMKISRWLKQRPS